MYVSILYFQNIFLQNFTFPFFIKGGWGVEGWFKTLYFPV